MAANEWSEKTRMIVTIAIGVVANIGLGAVLYSAHGDWKKLDTDLQAKKKTIESLKKIVDEKPAKEAKLKGLQADFETKKEKLPDAAAIEKLIDDLAPIADRNSCKRKTWRRSANADAGPGANLAKSTFSTTWDADFFGWCKMINEIEERFPRFISFESMRLTPKNSGMVVTGATHDLSVDIVTYQYIRSGL
jgi:Tfp pilus assembly protein PilO